MYDPERTGLAALRQRVEAKQHAAQEPTTFGIARLISHPDATVEPPIRKGSRTD